jgi:hypothetical protein
MNAHFLLTYECLKSCTLAAEALSFEHDTACIFIISILTDRIVHSLAGPTPRCAFSEQTVPFARVSEDSARERLAGKFKFISSFH